MLPPCHLAPNVGDVIHTLRNLSLNPPSHLIALIILPLTSLHPACDLLRCPPFHVSPPFLSQLSPTSLSPLFARPTCLLLMHPPSNFGVPITLSTLPRHFSASSPSLSLSPHLLFDMPLPTLVGCYLLQLALHSQACRGRILETGGMQILIESLGALSH